MNVRFFYVSLFCSVLVSCGDFTKEKTFVDENPKAIEITAADIYDGQIINTFLKNKKKFISESNDFYFKGIDSYKNKENVDSALHYFVQSILKEPNGRAYYELGNVLKEKKRFETAMKAYKMAEQMNYEPFSNILYQMATIYALEEKEESYQYIEYAMQAGFDDMDKLNADKSFDSIRENYRFESAVKTGILGMGDPTTMFWLGFKRQFPVAKLPFTTKVNHSNDEVQKLKYISYDYERYISEMRDNAFSREVGVGYFFVSIVQETEEYVALLYMARDEYMGEYAPSMYRIATFSPKGKLIDKKMIAGQNGLTENLRQAKISANGQIDIDVFEIEYSKDPEEFGFEENPIKSKKKIGSEKMTISSSGKIVKQFSAGKDLAIN